jgi:hypothetical protein
MLNVCFVIVMLSLIMLTVIMLSAILLSVFIMITIILSVIIVECHHDKCHYTECCGSRKRPSTLSRSPCFEATYTSAIVKVGWSHHTNPNLLWEELLQSKYPFTWAVEQSDSRAKSNRKSRLQSGNINENSFCKTSSTFLDVCGGGFHQHFYWQLKSLAKQAGLSVVCMFPCSILKMHSQGALTEREGSEHLTSSCTN